jgi:hypothetical protein
MITMISRKIRGGYRIMKHTVCHGLLKLLVVYGFKEYQKSLWIIAMIFYIDLMRMVQKFVRNLKPAVDRPKERLQMGQTCYQILMVAQKFIIGFQYMYCIKSQNQVEMKINVNGSKTSFFGTYLHIYQKNNLIVTC